jgi:hypothetical protein
MNNITSSAMRHNEPVFRERFVRHIPNRLGLSIELDLDEDTQRCSHSMDCIEYHYRRYVSGQSRDLRRVFFQIRQYLNCGYLPEVITKMLEDVSEMIIQEEFYELMPRVTSSYIKITGLIANHGLVH